MSVKIRLSRKGKKHQALYHIIATDSRAPRDGRFIEKLGIYNPNTVPATIELDFDSALAWLQKGAQPSDTCRSILSVKGVMLKKHLMEGVAKGAFNEDEANRRFNEWLEKKEAQLRGERDADSKQQAEERRNRLAAEAKVNEKRKAELIKKQSELAAEAAKAASAAEATVSDQPADQPVDQPAAEVGGTSEESKPE